ncbi:MAG: hypothetical protein ACI4BC_01180 [Muribaculaceae bacterium]
MKRFLLSIVLLAVVIGGGRLLLDWLIGPAHTLSVAALPVEDTFGKAAHDTAADSITAPALERDSIGD